MSRDVFSCGCSASQPIAVFIYFLAICGVTRQVRGYSQTGQNLVVIPSDISVAETSVDLSDNSLMTIPSGSFSDLVLMTHLKLSANVISTVSATALCTSGITHLDLESNVLTSVPDLACVGGQLLSLNLGYNRITALQAGDFDSLSALQVLQLKFNVLSGDLLPLAAIAGTAVKIDLSDNDVASIGTIFTGFGSLLELRLGGNPKLDPIATNALDGCPSLYLLNISSCSLDAFPDVSSVGITLSILNLHGNDISNLLLTDFEQLDVISDFDLSQNVLLFDTIAILDSWPGRTDIETLNLTQIGMTSHTLHGLTFAGFSALQTLTLSSNAIGEMPDLIHVAGTLEVLYLDVTGIRYVTATDVNYLTSLSRLFLRDNDIAAVTDVLGIAAIGASLQHVSLAGNPVPYSDNVYQLGNLVSLDLQDTAVTCLHEPPVDAGSTRPATIDLRGTPLVCDACLCWLKASSDVTVTLSDNPCHGPAALVDQPWDTVTQADLHCPGVTQNPFNADAIETTVMGLIATQFELEWNEWLPWSECTRSCGGGTHYRLRVCESDNLDTFHCPELLATDFDVYLGYEVQNVDCNVDPCPVHGIWGQWTEWTNCSTSCDAGIIERRRHCNGPYNDGDPCPGREAEFQMCDYGECPVEVTQKKSEYAVEEGPAYKESDERPSAQNIGYVSVGFLVTILVSVLLLDVSTLHRQLAFCKRNLDGSPLWPGRKAQVPAGGKAQLPAEGGLPPGDRKAQLPPDGKGELSGVVAPPDGGPGTPSHPTGGQQGNEVWG